MDFYVLCLTSIFSYILLFLLTKMMGNKQISQLDFFDYITGITIGSIAAEFATELESPWKPMVAMIIYAIATILLSVLSRKFPRTRKYLNGTSRIIMDNGKLDRENLRKSKLDLNEFMVMCREQGYFDLNSIHTAIFESNGKLTILPNSLRRPATPEDLHLQPKQEILFTEVIMDGRIVEKNLNDIGLDLSWLMEQLEKQGISSPKEVFLAVCDRNQNINIYKNEDNK